MSLFDPDWDAEVDAGGGAVLRAVRLGTHAGAERLAANLYELDPGAIVSPLHFHHANEELLFVLSGAPSVRLAAGAERALAPGDVVSFAAGPAGLHQVVNRSGARARVLICATNDLPEVAEQPENEALAMITRDGLRIVPSTQTITAQ